MASYSNLGLQSVVVFAVFATELVSQANAQSIQPGINPNRKELCIIEKAAGIMSSQGSSLHTPTIVNFAEEHRRFTVTFSAQVLMQFQRDFCTKTIMHWQPIMQHSETFDPKDTPQAAKYAYDYRLNIGKCFASEKAIIKYFDRDHPNELQSYDFLPNLFSGLPGNWIEFRDGTFQGGETLDDGPVVISGTCQVLD